MVECDKFPLGVRAGYHQTPRQKSEILMSVNSRPVRSLCQFGRASRRLGAL